MASFPYFLLFALCHSINCPKDDDCQCTENEPCILDCIGLDYCKDSDLQCKTGYPCALNCDGSNACTDGTFIPNGATSVTITCQQSDACSGNAFFECQSNVSCSIDCTSTASACSSLDIETNSASSFICSGNNCPSNAPPYAAPTISPTIIPTITPSLSTSSSQNPSTSPSRNPSTSPSQNPSTSPTRNPSLSPTQNPSLTPTTKYATTIATEISSHLTIFPSQNPTDTLSTITNLLSSNPTETPTIRPTFIVQSKATKVDTMFTTIDTYADSNSIFGIDVQMLLYIGIGAAVLCLLLGFVVLIAYKKRKARRFFTGNNWNTRPKSPLSTSCNKVQSFAVALVEENPNESVNENANDIKNISPKNMSPTNTFQENLMNKVAVDNLMMNDVVQDMTTPGYRESGNNAIGIEMNPLAEGDTESDSNDVDDVAGNGNLTLDKENINNGDDGIDDINSHDVEIVYQVNDEMVTKGYDEEEYDIQYDDED